MVNETEISAMPEHEIEFGEYFVKGNFELVPSLLNKLYSNRLHLIRKNRDALHFTVTRFSNKIAGSIPQIYVHNCYIDEVRFWKNLYADCIFDKIEDPFAVKNPFEIHNPAYQTFLEDIIYDVLGLKAKPSILPFERLLKTREFVLSCERKDIMDYFSRCIQKRCEYSRPCRDYHMSQLPDFVEYLFCVFDKMGQINLDAYPALQEAVDRIRFEKGFKNKLE